MSKFTCQSTATDIVKAKRFLKSLADIKDYRYFYSDGFPHHEAISQDASATLEVLEKLEPTK